MTKNFFISHSSTKKKNQFWERESFNLFEVLKDFFRNDEKIQQLINHKSEFNYRREMDIRLEKDTNAGNK